MPFSLGFWAAAGAGGGGGGAGSFELITSTILSGSQASVTFDVSTYASTYKHLQIRYAARDNRADAGDYFGVYFNSDTTATNYYTHQLQGYGGSVTSAAYNSSTSAFLIHATNDPANTYGAGVVDILDPFSSSKYKTLRGLSGMNGTYPTIRLSSLLWKNTATVTSLSLVPNIGSFVSGSRFSLYGIKA